MFLAKDNHAKFADNSHDENIPDQSFPDWILSTTSENDFSNESYSFDDN